MKLSRSCGSCQSFSRKGSTRESQEKLVSVCGNGRNQRKKDRGRNLSLDTIKSPGLGIPIDEEVHKQKPPIPYPGKKEAAKNRRFSLAITKVSTC